MKSLLPLFALLMVFGCHTSSVGPDLSSPQDTPISSQSGNTILKDSAKPLTAKLDTTPLPPEHYHSKGYDSIGWELMDTGIGWLKCGTPMSKVIAMLGQPESKTDTAMSQIDGLLYQGWSYKKQGISIYLEGEKISKFCVASITIYSPCILQTNRRVGIGSTEKEIEKAYRKAIEAVPASGERWIVAGTVYGGILFTMHNHKVDTLFIGASAE